MIPGRWQRVENLFHQASELPAEERDRWLAAQCQEEPDLIGEVLALLQSDVEGEGQFVKGQVGSALQNFASVVPRPAIERHVGPYRLLRELGRGGMGTVFLAEHMGGEYQQPVAVKLVRAGMDTDFFLVRFRRERQTLARLHHTNIARLLDSGTSLEELPYLVMEFVDGVPLHHYCDAHQLSIDGRLQIFLAVCAAVSHAHQRFVVHRDIKPANILVDQAGVPKLLDFGICKLLQHDSAPADVTGVNTLLTPDFASPEQVRGEPITVASDIYSLGGVLYLLLTGQRPHRFEKNRPQDVEYAICEAPVILPSAAVRDRVLSRRLVDDLDTIIMRAMHKEPERRYPSVEEMASDIRRHLQHLPISARPDTAAYRARKYARRNQGLLVACLVAGLAIVTGAVFAVKAASRAELHIGLAREFALLDSDRSPSSRDANRFLNLYRQLALDAAARGQRTEAVALAERALARSTASFPDSSLEQRVQIARARQLGSDVYASLGETSNARQWRVAAAQAWGQAEQLPGFTPEQRREADQLQRILQKDR